MTLYRYCFLVFFAFSFSNLLAQCPEPINLNTSNITDSSVVISWEEPPASDIIDRYRIKYRKINESYDAWYDSNIPTTTFSKQIDNLEFLTEYEVMLKSVCDVSNNITSLPVYISFFTSSGCTEPSACNYNPEAIQDDGSCIFPDTTNLIVAECDSYFWADNQEIYTESGLYIYSNPENCEYKILNLTIYNSIEGNENVTSCNSYFWNGQDYTESGIYIFSGQTINGCDSLVELNLTINPNEAEISNIYTCDVYAWNGSLYNQSGTFYFSDENNCQSILNLTIVNEFQLFFDTIVSCGSYDWNGTLLTESGNYQYQTLSQGGCDSIVQLSLTVANESYEEDITACDSFIWNGISYFESGTYTDTATNSFGCDSVNTINLTINNSTFSESYLNLCSPSYLWNNSEYTQSGIYYFDTINASGCDSTVILNLFLTTPVTSSNEIICYGDSTEITAYQSYPGEIAQYTYGGMFMGSHYYVSNNPTTWSEGDSVANVFGGHLVSISSLEENNFVNSLSPFNQWLGLYSTDELQSFQWVNNESFVYSNWYDLQPGGTGNVTLMYGLEDPINLNTNALGKWTVVSDIDLPSNDITAYTIIEFSNQLTWSTGDTSYNLLVSPSQTTTYYSYFEDGIDSVTITVLDTSLTFLNVESCQSFDWNGITYTESGSYNYLTTNTAGCDSLIVLNLTINYPSIDTISVTTCDIYEWNEQVFTVSGLYNYNTTGLNGCDSTVYLNLIIVDSLISVTNEISACSSYLWNDSIYTESGTYSYQTNSNTGCDTLYTLNLSIFEGGNSESWINYCGYGYLWNNSTYYQNGTYTFQTINAYGCDSIATLHLIITSPIVSDDVTICYGDSIEITAYQSSPGDINDYTYAGLFNGSHYYISDNSTTWTEGQETAQLYGGHLVSISSEEENNFVSNISTHNIWLGLFGTDNQSLSWENQEEFNYSNWNNLQPDESGTVVIMYGSEDPANTISDVTGSWSFVSNVALPSNNIACYSIIEFSNQLTWSTGEQSYSIFVSPTQSTSYVTSFQEGIDSVIVTVLDSNFNTLNITVCDSMDWNDSVYTESGTYTYTTSNIAGCDSTVVLNLNVNKSAFDTINIQRCEIYEWNNQEFTVSGQYNYYTTTQNGCDSIATLNLIINNYTDTSIAATACSQYLWNNTNYTESGIYTDTLININGCDSIITLNLSIIADTVYTVTDTSVCNLYSFQGVTYTQSDTIIYTSNTEDGCISIETIYLNIQDTLNTYLEVSSCFSYDWNDSTYAESGNYSFISSTNEGCISIATLELTILDTLLNVLDTATCTSFDWNDSTYTESGSYTWEGTTENGCWLIDSLNLTIIDSLSSTTNISACQSYIWNEEEYSESGSYMFETTSSSGCDSIAFLNLEICTLDELTISGLDAVSIESTTTYSVNSSSESSTFNWIIDGLGTINNGQSSNEISVNWSSTDGNTKICVTETLDCNGTECIGQEYCLDISVTNPSEILSINTVDLIVFPNPFSEELTVEFSNPTNEKVQINIIDTRGRIVRKYRDLKSNSLVVQKKDLTSGLYYIEILASKKQYRTPIIVE